MVRLLSGTLLLSLLLAACSQPESTTSPTPDASATPAPTYTPRPTHPSPSASPRLAPKGTILIDQPRNGQFVSSPMDIRGAASTFDGTVYWRVMDPVGHLLASGFTKVNPRAAASGEQFSPNTGSYFAVAKFQIGSNTGGYLEVYSLSQLGDGKIADSVRVDLHIEAP